MNSQTLTGENSLRIVLMQTWQTIVLRLAWGHIYILIYWVCRLAFLLFLVLSRFDSSMVRACALFQINLHLWRHCLCLFVWGANCRMWQEVGRSCLWQFWQLVRRYLRNLFLLTSCNLLQQVLPYIYQLCHLGCILLCTPICCQRWDDLLVRIQRFMC